MKAQEPLEKREQIRSWLIGLLITFIVTTVIAGLALLFQILYGLTFQEDALRIMCNCTFFAGVIVAAFYVLVVLSNNGAYDLLTYSIKLVWYNTFHKNVRKSKLAASYPDYREEKRGKKKTNVSFMIVGALPYIIAGIILAIPYFTM